MPKGPLDWRVLLQWLLDDGLINAEDVDRVGKRFAAGSSSLHALVRLGGAGLVRQGTNVSLDVEGLTEWLALRCGLGYQRIDPLVPMSAAWPK